ncbi:winged helix-turn-helix domain-containing protein, partial [Defluviimonas sp. D31]|uniref:winged helix-turn-helix domain-containing protein n=1 Tax=Defluviimonas sp. D31 TaxID=3083253 RepID=UPI00296E3489
EEPRRCSRRVARPRRVIRDSDPALVETGSNWSDTTHHLLKLFAENRGRVLNRDQILEGAHDRSWEPFDRSIDIRISRIRKKIERNPQKPEAIRTVRGIGYIYDTA